MPMGCPLIVPKCIFDFVLNIILSTDFLRSEYSLPIHVVVSFVCSCGSFCLFNSSLAASCLCSSVKAQVRRVQSKTLV